MIFAPHSKKNSKKNMKKLHPGLLSHYGPGHHDYTDTNMALSKVKIKSFISYFYFLEYDVEIQT